MEILTKEKLIEIFKKHRHLVRVTKAGDVRMGLLAEDFEDIASDIFVFHNAEIAKYKELVETQKELIEIHEGYIGDYTRMQLEDKTMELRRKIAELESEVGK